MKAVKQVSHMDGREANAVRDYMSALPRVIGPTEPISKARHLMHKFGIRHLIVMGQTGVTGIISDRDIGWRDGLREDIDEDPPLEEAMTPIPYFCGPNTSLHEAADLMLRERIGALVVMDKDVPVGIFTAVDGIRALRDLTEPPARSRSGFVVADAQSEGAEK
jgi:CBS domain-containing protein